MFNDEKVFKFTANDRLLLPNAIQANPNFKAAADEACALWDQQQQEIIRNRPVCLPARLTAGSPAKPVKVVKS